MKRSSILIFILMIAVNLLAQDNGDSKEIKTIFGGDKITHGGYGGLSINYSKIDDADAILVGARGGWIINHGISIGIGGYGFANDISYEKTINDVTNKYTLAGGYGGLLIEPIIGANWPVHHQDVDQWQRYYIGLSMRSRLLVIICLVKISLISVFSLYDYNDRLKIKRLQFLRVFSKINSHH